MQATRLVLALLFLSKVDAKIFDKCELFRTFSQYFPADQINDCEFVN